MYLCSVVARCTQHCMKSTQAVLPPTPYPPPPRLPPRMRTACAVHGQRASDQSAAWPRLVCAHSFDASRPAACGGCWMGSGSLLRRGAHSGPESVPSWLWFATKTGDMRSAAHTAVRVCTVTHRTRRWRTTEGPSGTCNNLATQALATTQPVAIVHRHSCDASTGCITCASLL